MFFKEDGFDNTLFPFTHPYQHSSHILNNDNENNNETSVHDKGTDINNLLILKLVYSQSFFTFINLRNNVSLNDKDIDWFYKFYQRVFYGLCEMLNLTNISFYKNQNIFKRDESIISKEEMWELYKSLFEFIPNNKNIYNKVIFDNK